jgi:hypothetical protein
LWEHPVAKNQDIGEKLTSLSWSSSSSLLAAFKGRMPRSCILLLQLALILLCICQPCPSEQSRIFPADQGNEPFPVYVSIGVINAGDLDVETGSFAADFYLELHSERNYSLESMELMNGFPTVMEVLDQTPTSKDYRIRAELSTAIDVRDFPIDRQVLPIIFEDRWNTSDKMIFVFDKKNSSLEPDLTLVGWIVEGFEGETREHTYMLNNSTFSRLEFNVYVRRAATTSVVIFFFPVGLLVFVSLLALLLKGQRLSNRISLNGTMLLAAILLHLRFAADLPTISYLTLADRFMIATYIVLVMALVSSVLLGFYTEKGDQRRVEFIYRYALLVTPILSLFVYIMLLGISLNS